MFTSHKPIILNGTSEILHTTKSVTAHTHAKIAAGMVVTNNRGETLKCLRYRGIKP